MVRTKRIVISKIADYMFSVNFDKDSTFVLQEGKSELLSHHGRTILIYPASDNLYGVEVETEEGLYAQDFNINKGTSQIIDLILVEDARGNMLDQPYYTDNVIYVDFGRK